MFPRLCFGSCQQRKLVPLHCSPDRLGNHTSRQAAPHLGPGCYGNHEFGTIMYNLQKRPGSKKGFSPSTAARFLPCSPTASPSPQQYQPDQNLSRIPPLNQTPFNSTAQRFKSTSPAAEAGPGPGTYAHDVETNRKVSWPMSFGSPDRSRVPRPEKKSLRVKLNGDSEFLKRRSRVAYLSLYY